MDPLDALRLMIDDHGWAVRNVVSADPALCLSYTVGLTAIGHPEVVMTGLPSKIGHAFLNIAGGIVIREGGTLAAGSWSTEFADGPPLPIIAVEDTSALTAVQEIYGRVSAVQVIWTDSRGQFPWDEDYANPPGSQPVLGSP